MKRLSLVCFRQICIFITYKNSTKFDKVVTIECVFSAFLGADRQYNSNNVPKTRFFSTVMSKDNDIFFFTYGQCINIMNRPPKKHREVFL